MQTKQSLILALTFVIIGLFAGTSFTTGFPNFFGVAPPSTYSGDGLNGTTRTITGALPGDFKENEQENIGYGTFSNRIFCRENNSDRFYVYVWISGDLLNTSTGKTIPSSSLQYIVTYTNGSGETNSSNFNKYVPFSIVLNSDWVYHSLLGEGGTGGAGSGMEREVQFKYAVKVPYGQSPGTYTGTINYSIVDSDAARTLTRTCPISVTVDPLFSMSIDRGTIDFDKMSPNETKDNIPSEGVIIASKSNTGNQWFLKIYNTSPLSSGAYMIPNTNFIWYGWKDGSGNWNGTGTDQMTLAPALMYSSGPGDFNTKDGIKNHLKFKLTIPRGQPAGKYITSVVVTQTE